MNALANIKAALDKNHYEAPTSGENVNHLINSSLFFVENKLLPYSHPNTCTILIATLILQAFMKSKESFDPNIALSK